MAEVTYRVSDLDGRSKVTGDAVYLQVNESAVSLDLTDKQKEDLITLLADYFAKGVEVAVRNTRTATRNAGSTNELLTGKAVGADKEEIRAWARERDFEVSDKGRIANDVYRAFNEWVNDPANADKVDLDA